MPPRYAYWTILVDGQPTAFRAASQEDLMPTFKRLKEKHPSAEMQWFQNGKLWPSRVDAQEAMRARGELGRRGDSRQDGFRDRKRNPRQSFPVRRSSPSESGNAPPREREPGEKLDWKPKGEFTPAPKRERSERPDWKPKGKFSPERPRRKPVGENFSSPAREGGDRDERPTWKPKGSFDRERKPEWKPKGSFDRDRKPAWKPKGSFDRKPEWKSKGSSDRGGKPEWKPKGSFDRERKPEWKPRGEAGASAPREKRAWIPKEEYKKSKGIEAPRDSKWRPGGAHRDPKQKYKDAKKAKWTKFKKTIRTRWEAKAGSKPPKKRRDEE